MSIPTSLHAARELIRVKASRNEFVELVHEATNEDPWGPTGTQMDDVCRAFPRGANAIMEEIKLRLRKRDKSWRSCYKALLLLDHLARNVQESGLPLICSVVSTVRLISQSFYHTGSKGTDHGLSVRERAKKLYELLSDGATLREERDKASVTRSKLYGASAFGGGSFPSSRYQGFSNDTAPLPSMSMSDSPPRPTLSREEQERRDMELAARMQREEEKRTGISVMDAERMFSQHARHHPAQVLQAAQNSDLELARRLEEEERQRRASHRDEELVSPVLSSPLPAKEVPVTALEETSLPTAEPPKPNLLDDLFSSPAAPTTNHVQLSGWTGSTSAQQQQLQQQQQQQQQHQSSSADPFDTFLDIRMQQQQQQQQHAEISFGGFQPAPTPQSQYPGVVAGGAGWNTMSAPPQGSSSVWYNSAPTNPPPVVTSSHNLWGMAPSNGGSFVPPGAHPVPSIPGSNDVPVSAAPGIPGSHLNTAGLMEQQMAELTAPFSGHKQQVPKSLDALMAERRAGE